MRIQANDTPAKIAMAATNANEPFLMVRSST
jgi:hypothetical protein